MRLIFGPFIGLLIACMCYYVWSTELRCKCAGGQSWHPRGKWPTKHHWLECYPPSGNSPAGELLIYLEEHNWSPKCVHVHNPFGQKFMSKCDKHEWFEVTFNSTRKYPMITRKGSTKPTFSSGK
uniref:UL146 n=1 Tax=Human cytomegalovirus TaxID=10359 RepID=Q5SED2_HCMV|nr:UL146 [Human betaherpesvirus 5]